MSHSAIFSKMPVIDTWSFGFIFWAVLIGVFLGLVVNMGPAFITLVQTSLDRGLKSAALFALGVILNDAMIITLCILTSVQVVVSNDSKIDPALFSIGAGIILVLFGIYTFRRRSKPKEEYLEKRTNEIVKEKNDKPSGFVFLFKGFVLNILNPFVWIFWFSAVAIVAGNMGGNKVSILMFFAFILGTTLTIELLKAWGAAKLKRFLTPEHTTIMNRVAGVLLMCFGAFFIIVRGIVNLF